MPPLAYGIATVMTRQPVVLCNRAGKASNHGMAGPHGVAASPSRTALVEVGKLQAVIDGLRKPAAAARRGEEECGHVVAKGLINR